MFPTVAFPSRIDPKTLGQHALAVVEAKGWDAWSLRDVAGALRVTANALYRHVGDRAGLEVAVGEAAARELQKALAEVQLETEGRSPEDVVVLHARAFVNFALSRPHAYAAWVHAKPPPDHPAMVPYTELWVHFNAVVRAATTHSADAAAFALWAYLIGRVALANGPGDRVAADVGLEDAVLSMLTGYRVRDPVVSPLPEDLQLDPK